MTAAILVAMPQELEVIPGITEKDPKERVAGIDIYELEPGLYACAGGVGKVNAAMAAEILCLRYAVDLIVSAGVAGCTRDSMALGSIMVASEFVQHDVDTSAVGDPPGMVSTVNRIVFPAYEPERCLSVAQRLDSQSRLGRIATGDWFVQNGDRLWEVFGRFTPLALDMEAGAVAQVCYRNGVRVTAIKSVSDHVFKDEQLDEYANYSQALAALGTVLIPFTKEIMGSAHKSERKGQST